MDFVTLEGIPLPPSINEAYCNRAGWQGRGRVKSAKYRTFDRLMFAWKLKQSELISQAIDFLGPDGFLEVNVTFYLPYKSVLTKNQRPKRHDVDNRLKILNDAVSLALGFDDSRISCQLIEKVAVHGLDAGHVEVSLRRSRILIVPK